MNGLLVAGVVPHELEITRRRFQTENLSDLSEVQSRNWSITLKLDNM